VVPPKVFIRQKNLGGFAPWDNKHGMNFFVAGIIGLISGITSGLFGVGGGIVMVPAMMFAMNVPIKTAIGTSLAVIIPTALVGSYKHYTQGNLDLKLALAITPMAILGGFGGAWLTTHISADNLKRTFGGFLVLVGVRLLFFK